MNDFNKDLLRNMKDRLESPHNRTMRSKSKEKLKKYEYSQEKSKRELEHVFFKTYS